MSKCPYCSRKLGPDEMWCWHCENDMRKVKNKAEKPQCFIATVVYGNDAYETNLLRNFRDTKLQGNFFGDAFITFYYSISPAIARVLSKNKALKVLTKKILNRIIKTIK